MLSLYHPHHHHQHHHYETSHQQQTKQPFWQHSQLPFQEPAQTVLPLGQWPSQFLPFQQEQQPLQSLKNKEKDINTTIFQFPQSTHQRSQQTSGIMPYTNNYWIWQCFAMRVSWVQHPHQSVMYNDWQLSYAVHAKSCQYNTIHVNRWSSQLSLLHNIKLK